MINKIVNGRKQHTYIQDKNLKKGVISKEKISHANVRQSL